MYLRCIILDRESNFRMLLATICVSIVKVNRQMCDCVLRTLNKTNGVVSSFHTKYVEILHGLMRGTVKVCHSMYDFRCYIR